MNGTQCFNSYLGMCPACLREFDKKRYLKTIDKIKLFLSGQTQKVIDNLEKEMMVLAKKMHFEDAKIIRDQIYKLKHINDIALIKNENIKKIINTRIEAYDVAHMMGKDMVGVMIVSDGNNFEKKEYKKFIIKNIESANDPLALEQILTRRFEHKEWSYPDYIIVDGNNIQISVAKKVLSMYKLDHVIKVCAVTKDDKHKANYVYKEGDVDESVIVSANAEAHRFAINYYRYKSRKSFLDNTPKNTF